MQICSQFAVSCVQNLQGLQGFLCLLDSECQNSYRKELSSGALARELPAVFPTAQALGKPPSFGEGGVTRMMQRLTKSHNIVVPTNGPKPVLLIKLAESTREDVLELSHVVLPELTDGGKKFSFNNKISLDNIKTTFQTNSSQQKIFHCKRCTDHVCLILPKRLSSYC